MVRAAMLMCEHHYKLVYSTSSVLLYPAASLSGATASTQQRSAPRLETSTAHPTWHAQLKILILHLMMGQGEHVQASSSPSDRRPNVWSQRGKAPGLNFRF